MWGRGQWIGFFEADRVDRIDGGYRFLVNGAGFIDQAGFAYSPNGAPEHLGDDSYRHYDGPWWIWSESW
jgi:hypothetical protein